MSKTFVIKLLNHLAEQAKADGNICKTYNNSAKVEKLKAYTGKELDYIDHLKEWSI